jgi:predicted amidohydrolase
LTPYSIAGLQLNLSAEHDNIGYVRTRLNLLMHIYPWVQMVVISELAAFGPSPKRAQRLPGPAEDEFREMAQRHQIWLLPGTLFEKSGERIYNTLSIINPSGEVVGRFRKLFPFRPYELGVDAGEEFLVFDVPDVARFGVSICYDMWFPETSRTLAAMGAEVILHPSLTPTIDREVELAIVRATAAQQQCFVFDINGSGDGGNGRSIIVGPYGDVLYQAGHAEEMIPIEIDIDRVRRSREIGLRGLGQPLKSFRDRSVHFGIYERGAEQSAYFQSLGPLQKPVRGTRAGLDRERKETI